MTTNTFDRFERTWAVLLTSYRRDGTPVGTPVSIAVDGDRGYVRSPGTGWKVKRMHREPHVEIAPCTFRGRPTGPSVPAVARRLDGEEAQRAARALRRRHLVLQGILVPLAHKLLRCGTAHYELRLDRQASLNAESPPVGGLSAIRRSGGVTGKGTF